MTASIFQPFYAAIDGNGVPMSGALLYFYKTGTTTPQDTFTDSGLGTPNANPVVADSNGLFPPIYLTSGPDYKAILKTSANVTVATRDPIEAPTAAPTLPTLRSFLAGLTLSAAGSSSIFGIAAGQCADSTNTVLMSLGSALTKTTSTWAAGTGNGSLDTGTIANNTWYHAYLIENPTTATVDVLTSLSASSPTMPATYTLKRRIGSLLTDGSAQWVAFVQDGDEFSWVAPVTGDVNAVNPGTSAVTRTLKVPTGIRVKAMGQVVLVNVSTATSSIAYLSDLSINDLAAAATGTAVADTALTLTNSSGTAAAGARFAIWTNTSAQIRSRLSQSEATNITLKINTFGWVDRRGRDS